jgi:hypothetical protein
MMFGPLDWIKLGAGAIIGMLLAAGPLYVIGKHEGRRQAAVERLQADVEAFVKREGIDNEVGGMDRYRICIELGGLPDQCEQLRGLGKAAGSQ